MGLQLQVSRLAPRHDFTLSSVYSTQKSEWHRKNCSPGRLPVARCLRLGLALTTALEHLHRNVLVHRDIKPSNIVFVNGIPKLADIGLVAQAEATMSFVGTEGFVPPEGPGTVQADIYSLGKVLYELSTGHDRHQFPELPTQLESPDERELLGELNEVLLKACQRNPAERYRTAAEMHADLALLESGRSVVRLRGIERRFRLVQRAGALVTALAMLAAGAFLYQRHATREAQRLADENRSLAEESIHRIRIQQTLNVTPRVLHVLEAAEEIDTWDWSDDGQRLVTGSWQGHFRIWDVSTGQPIGAPGKLEVDWLHQARFIDDGRRISLSDLRSEGPIKEGWRHQVPTNQVTVVESDTGKHAFTLAGTHWSLTGISRDGRWIAIADQHHVIRLHDASAGQLLAEMRGHTEPLSSP